MSKSWIDPGSLEGEILKQWYLRSPADVERGRQEAEARRYQDFFFGDGNYPGMRFDSDNPASGQDVDPGFAMPAFAGNVDPGFTTHAVISDVDPGFARGADRLNRFGSVMAATDGQSAGTNSPAFSFDSVPLDGRLRSNASYRPPANSPPLDNALRRASAQSNQHPPVDPLKTPVFQTGPDGKLHPIAGWRTTGPFDFGKWSHNIHWGGVVKDLTEIGLGVAGFFGGVGFGGELLSALGPEAETAVAEGIAESPAAKAATQEIHGHHAYPKYMGGAADGEREDLVAELHRRFHGLLAKAHREAGFPPVGGKSGSTVEWLKHFELNPGSREEAMEILRRVSREFDETYGTNISSKLPSPTRGAEAPPPE